MIVLIAIRHYILLAHCFSLFYQCVLSTPYDPFEEIPKLDRPASTPIVITIMDNFAFDNLGVTHNTFLDMSSVQNMNYCKIILDITGKNRGRQFDRYGVFWLGDIEILRTTTPEPSVDGITWNIEKELTIYGTYLTQKSSLLSYALIPNNVDSTYTGIIYLNATLSFYLSSADCQLSSSLPDVIPITYATKNGTMNPWSNIYTNQNNSIQSLFSLPTKYLENDIIINKIVLDVYSSNHECEEFYYSNTHDVNATEYDSCPGGNYRELQVYLNGTFAGSFVPFPVVYTGGINPYLWRPISGIRSFNIPSLQFDITPFMGTILNSTFNPITIEIHVLTSSSNRVSSWILNTQLFIYSEPTLDVYIKSASMIYYSNLFNIKTTSEETDLGITFYSTISHDFCFNATLFFSNGSIISYTLYRSLFTRSSLTLTDENWMFASVEHSAKSTVTESTQTSIQEWKHYLGVADYYGETDNSFSLRGTVKNGYSDCEYIYLRNSPASSLCSITGIDSRAVYNVTNDLLVNKESSSSAFYIRQIPAKEDSCYAQKASSSNGFKVDESTIYFCGAKALNSVKHLKMPPTNLMSENSKLGLLPFRANGKQYWWRTSSNKN